MDGGARRTLLLHCIAFLGVDGASHAALELPPGYQFHQSMLSIFLADTGVDMNLCACTKHCSSLNSPWPMSCAALDNGGKTKKTRKNGRRGMDGWMTLAGCVAI